MTMVLLQGFLDVLFKALISLGLSLSVGGVAFALLVLRPLGASNAFPAEALRRTLAIVTVGAAVVAVSQLMILLIEPLAFADDPGSWPIAAFLQTVFAKAGMIRAFFSICLGGGAIRLLRQPGSRPVWLMTGLAALLLAISGGWLVHAVSRLEDVVPLMISTVVHQTAAVLWVGGVIQCVLLRKFMGAAFAGTDVWPILLARFSPVAMISVAILIGSGIYLAFNYIGDWGGLIGTAYGTMVVTKMALLGVALCMGGLNNLSVRRWKQNGDPCRVNSYVPPFVEAEAGTGAVILLAAAALTSQPPAIDVIADRASPMEVLKVFTPKAPQLVPPHFREMLAQAASSLDPFAVSGTLDKIQSNFNHNISAIFVLLAGFLAMLDRTGKMRRARHWPLSFLLLGVFILLIGEPNGWPFGTEGFWETLVSPGVLQHRFATVLVFGLAISEWRVQAGNLAHTRWRFAFPILCFVGGALLLTHSHSVFASKWAFLIEVSHNAIGFLAVLMGVGRWLDLRLPPDGERFPRYLWPVCMMLVGFVLLFYREV